VEEKMESALKRKDVWVVADSIVSPLGNSSEENFSAVVKSISGLKTISDPSLSSGPVHTGRITEIEVAEGLTRFEQMCVNAISGITAKHFLPGKTLLILSTTKGNIDLLKSNPSHPRIHLHAAARHVASKCGLSEVLIVSNACISGVMAITVANRYLQHGVYDHAIVVGADELTSFVVSGFQSLGALSSEPCRPFDKDRNGINLGEAAAAVLLTVRPESFSTKPVLKVLGSGLTNDANHISGPSRTGEELALAIDNALVESNLEPSAIDFISAHGTATLYNDEMEAKAFTLARLQKTPLNSLKGFYGHTLGAAGVLEIIIGVHSLKNNMLVPSLGFSENGVSQNLNVITNSTSGQFQTLLKTASGFGGCNAAIVLQKHS
jgi:3-oxoacyl-[acyl-carrier-protein] synthase I